MKKVSLNTGNLMTCVLELLVGILLLIDPVGFTSAIIVIFGILLTVAGIFSIVKYFRTDAETASQEHGLDKGLVCALFGLFCVFKSNWFLGAFPLLTVLYGILMLACGVCKIQWTVDMLRMKQKYWYIGAISAALTIIFAVLVLINPFSAVASLWTFVGVTMIIEAVLDIVTFICGRNEKK